MAFKKTRKSLSNYVGSISGDKNDIISKVSGRFGSVGNLSNSFDQRIADGLSDLFTGATGIRTSNIPEMSAEVLQAKETNRTARAKALTGRTTGKASAVGPVAVSNTPLRFPTNWSTENNQPSNMQNYIHFRSLKRKNTDVNDVLNDIFLYVPDTIQDDVSLTYEEGDRGFAESAIGDGAMDSFGEFVRMSLNEVGPAKIVKAKFGQTINPMKFQIFQGVNFRTFSYDFTFYPESSADSIEIQKILYAFKKEALPGTTGANNRRYTFPTEWAIRYHGPMKNWIDYPMVSACSDVKVNYAVNGNQRMNDGAPQAVGLSLSFMELVTLDRDKYDTRVSSLMNTGNDLREGTQERGSHDDIQTGGTKHLEQDKSRLANFSAQSAGKKYEVGLTAFVGPPRPPVTLDTKPAFVGPVRPVDGSGNSGVFDSSKVTTQFRPGR